MHCYQLENMTAVVGLPKSTNKPFHRTLSMERDPFSAKNQTL